LKPERQTTPSHYASPAPRSPAQAAPTAQAILAASDAVRNPDKPFSLTVALVEYKNGSG